jgi:OOP family OmpA-OmpF porin
MSVNILDLAKGYLTSGVIEKLSSFVGEDSSKVKNAVGAILPVILGGIMKKASTTSGATELMGILQNESSSSLLGDFSGFIGDSGNTNNLLSMGAKWLPSLLGNHASEVTNSIANTNGLRSSSTSSLMGLVTPLLMGVIGNQVKSSGMGLSGLTSMLMSQKDSVLSALPSGLSSMLNFSDLGDFKGSGEPVRPHHQPTVETRQSSPNWIPWVIGALILIGIIWGMKNCKKEGADVADAGKSAVNTVTDATDSMGASINAGLERLGAFFSRKLPSGVELNIPEYGIENNLITFIEDKNKAVDKTTWFNFDRIAFETGSAKLSAESLEQIKNLGEILKAYPNVNLKIGGYTDNTGDAKLNLKLSQDRAAAVKAAIVSEGVAAARLDAEGYGSEHPVASNDTEEGRAQNRRIAVRVSKK